MTNTYHAPKDAPKNLKVELEEGDFISIDRKDPFGFIYLTLSSGANIPEKYTGAYTTFDLALSDAKRYKEDRLEAKKELDKWQDKKASQLKTTSPKVTSPKQPDSSSPRTPVPM